MRKSELGLTIVEMVGALAVLSAVVVGTFTLANQSASDTRLTIAAMQLKTVGDAAEKYIRANRTTVSAKVPPAFDATRVAKITVAELVTDNHLPTGFASRTPFGQEICVLVWEPSPDNLRAMVVAENIAGSQPIEDANLGQLASSIGGAGGGVYASSAANITGAMKGWTFSTTDFAKDNDTGSNCAGTAGQQVALTAGTPVMALWFSDTTSTSPGLYRSPAGNDALNTMNTPILMSSIQVEGAGCTFGAIGRNVDGHLLSCVNPGIWERAGSWAWADPVANFGALPPADPDGTVRTTLDTGRAFVKKAAVWEPLAVDQNGHLTATGRITAGDFKPDASIAAGGACPDNGAIAKDSGDAGIVICTSGTWKTAPDGVGTFGQFDCNEVGHKVLPQVAECPAGYYVAGSFDNGPGYVGDDGIVCCSPKAGGAPPPPPPPVIGTCAPTVLWGGDCSRNESIDVPDNGITVAANLTNTAVGFIGDADIQCRDADPTAGSVNPQWVVTNPNCVPDVGPPPPLTAACPVGGAGLNWSQVIVTDTWNCIPSAGGVPATTIGDNGDSGSVYIAGDGIREGDGLTGSGNTYAKCVDADASAGSINPIWNIVGPSACGSFVPPPPPPITGNCGPSVSWGGNCSKTSTVTVNDNATTGIVTLNDDVAGFTGTADVQCRDADPADGVVDPQWVVTNPTCAADVPTFDECDNPPDPTIHRLTTPGCVWQVCANQVACGLLCYNADLWNTEPGLWYWRREGASEICL